jgi:hypothetical protein
MTRIWSLDSTVLKNRVARTALLQIALLIVINVPLAVVLTFVGKEVGQHVIR